MNYKMIGRFIGHILLVEAVFMLPALAISLFCKEDKSSRAFLLSLCIILVVAAVLLLLEGFGFDR